MNNDNETEEIEDYISSYEIQTENEDTEIIDEDIEEIEQFIDGAIDSDIDNISSSVSEVMLTDIQHTEILNSISLLNHTNYVLCALLLSLFIYTFLRDLFERRKV